jgi:hypothetical protein
MTSILHLAHNMEEELPGSDLAAPNALTPPIVAFVVVRQHGGLS